MTLRTFARRDGLTLIELLVVIGLSIALLTLGVFLVPSINDKRQVARGADQLQGWLSLGKQRAIRDQAPRGYRLVAESVPGKDGSFGTYYTSLQPIEQPDIITLPDGTAISVSSSTGKTTFSASYGELVTVTLPVDVNQSNLLDIQKGDFFSVSTGDVTTHVVETTPVPAGANSTQFTMYIRGKSLDSTQNVPLRGVFTFYRAAQPTAGESPLRLPDRVVISSDPNKSVNLTTDIIFSRNGQLRNATGGRVVLWVHHLDDLGDPTLMTIYARSGGVVAHPAASPPDDPLKFTWDGMDSGL